MDESYPEYTRELVVRKAGQVFPNENVSDVMAVLDRYNFDRERERVQLATLRLSQGDIDKLREFIEAAQGDYRDVLAWAEYLRECELSSQASDEDRVEAREADRRDYLAWLEGDGLGPPISPSLP